MSLYGRALGWMDRIAGRGQGPKESALMEALEPRVLLDASFPDISDLVNPENTVVRFKTTLGEIDFELYDRSGPGGASAAPITVDNFLNYVNSGRYFESFFHRSVNVSSTNPDIDGDPFIIQGGGFIFNDDDGLSRVDTDEAIANEANADRSNVERSLAMALVTSLGTDTATSQFFINLRDNNGSQGFGDIDLDAQDFTVFGRVANDRSWSVVEAIQNLDTFVFADVFVDDEGNLTDNEGNPSSQPFFLDNPDADVVSFALTDVPVRSDPGFIAPGEIRSTSLEERFLVQVNSTLVIKPADAEGFYTFLIGNPEGYANDTSVTYVELTANTSGGSASFYQIVLRYETGMRDQVLTTGMLEPGTRTRIAVSDPAGSEAAQARKFTPFAIEVHSTEGMSASLTHTDFGATLTESFVNFADLDSRGPGAFLNWGFGGLASTVGDADTDGSLDNIDTRESYIVWQNLEGTSGTVTVTVYTDASSFQSATFTLEGHRRGGIELHNSFGFATQGVQAINVESSVPIIASMSTYDSLLTADGSAAFANVAYSALGVIDGGATEGVLTGVQYTNNPNEEAYVTFLNTGLSGTVVTLTISDEAEFSGTRNIVLAPRDRGEFNLDLLVFELGGEFAPGEILTIRYSSTLPVAGQYTAVIGNEAQSTAFQTQLSDLVIISGGFDPGDDGEVISLYNPYNDTADIDLNFSVQFYFFDRNQFVQFGLLPMLEPGESASFSARDFNDVLATITLGEDWGRYTIFIAGIAVPSGGGTTPNAGQFGVSLSRIGDDGVSGRAVTMSTGTFGQGTLVDLSDDIFDGGIGT